MSSSVPAMRQRLALPPMVFLMNRHEHLLLHLDVLDYRHRHVLHNRHVDRHMLDDRHLLDNRHFLHNRHVDWHVYFGYVVVVDGVDLVWYVDSDVLAAKEKLVVRRLIFL